MAASMKFLAFACFILAASGRRTKSSSEERDDPSHSKQIIPLEADVPQLHEYASNKPLATLLLASNQFARPSNNARSDQRSPLQQAGSAQTMDRGNREPSRISLEDVRSTHTAAPVMSTLTSSSGTADVFEWLSGRVKVALSDAFGAEHADTNPAISYATKPEFGDFQCNVALPLAKKLKMKPRDVATKILETLTVDEVFEPPEIAGPGFLNLRFKLDFMQQQLNLMLQDSETCAVAAATPSQRVVVDYSSPNIAKEMHVGHLRSTIIGDTLSRILEFRGHDVLRLNHVGDWGTQFGMLILHLIDQAPDALVGKAELEISDLVAFYREAKIRFDSDEAFKDQARKEVVKLQSGDEKSLAAWRMLCGQSEVAFNKVYEVLTVDPRLQTRGESFYNPMLTSVIDTLRSANLLEESEGANCVFVPGYTNRDGDRLPMIVQKTDGGFMYSTTDLAAVKQRVEEEKADRILYVTDSGQSSHFDQVFKISRLAGIAPEKVSLEHVPFGLVLGEDGKKFKTRSGDTVKLMDLLTEAVTRTRSDMQSRMETEGRTEDADYIEDVSRAIGIGAVKYADLTMNRNSDYRFSYDKMLSMKGNTAPYMMYAYARLRGIQRKTVAKLVEQGAEADDILDFKKLKPNNIILETNAELELARHILKFAETLREVERELLPSSLCNYLYDLSAKFNKFYEECPVLGAGSDELRTSRLALCELSASVLKVSLGLLGLEAIERM